MYEWFYYIVSMLIMDERISLFFVLVNPLSDNYSYIYISIVKACLDSVNI